MKRYRFLGWLAAGIGVCLCSQKLLVAAETGSNDRSSRASTTARKPAYQGDMAPVLEKLDEVLASQEKMDKRFDAVMEELRIVKVRALMGGSASGN